MTNKSIKVGLEIVDETKEFNKLAKGINELERAGVEVDELKDSISSLSKSYSDVENKQGLINHFKDLKRESTSVKDEITQVSQAVKQHQTAIKSLESAHSKNNASLALATKKQAEYTEKLKDAERELRRLEKIRKTEAGLSKEEAVALGKARREVEKLQTAKSKLADSTKKYKQAVTSSNKALKAENSALLKSEKQLTTVKNKRRDILVTMRKYSAELKKSGISVKNLANEEKRLATKANLVELGHKSLARKMRQAREEIDKTARVSKKMGGSVDKSTNSLGRVAVKAGIAGIAIAGLTRIAKEIITVFTGIDAKFDAMERSFTEITGSTEAANVEMNRMIDVAGRLGLSFSEVSSGYSKFLASAKGANFTFSESADLFEKTSAKVLALGGDTESINGVLLAFSQILSKGKLATEELNQIAERLPGTFQFASEAMGVTSAELRKMLEQGEIMSNDFLPKFIAQLKTTSTAQETNAQTSARLKNEWELLVKSLDDSIGVSDGVQSSMNGLAKAIKLLRHESEGDIDIIPDGIVDKIVASIPIVNALAAGVEKLAEEAGKFVDRQNAIAEANAKAKQSTDELVQSLIRLNEARKGGDAAAIAKAEREYSAALEKTSDAYAKVDKSSGTHEQKLKKIKREIKELTPKYDELVAALQREKDAGLESTVAYKDKAKQAEELGNKLDALKTATNDLSEVKVGVIDPDEAAKTQQAIDGIVASLKEQNGAAVDARNTLDQLTASAKKLAESGNTQTEHYRYLQNAIASLTPVVSAQESAVESLQNKLAELNPEYAIFADAVDKTALVLDSSTTTTRKYEQALSALGKSFSEYATGVADNEQKIIDGTDEVLIKLNELGGSAKENGERLSRYLSDAGSKIKTPEGLKQWIEKLKEYKAEAEKAFDPSTMNAEAHKAKLKIIKDSIESMQDSLNKATPAWVELHDAMSKATSSQQIEALRTKVKQAFEDQKISVDQFNQSLKDLSEQQEKVNKAGIAELAENTKQRTQAVQVTRKQTEAVKEQAAATKEATAATEADTSASKANTQGVIEWTANAKNRIRTLEQLGLTTEQTAQAVEAYQKRMDGGSVASLEQYLQKITGVADEITRQGEAFAETRNRAIEMTDVLSDNAASTEDLAIAQDALFHATNASIDGLVEMDQTTLDNLRNAIEKTKAEMEDFADTTEEKAKRIKAQLESLRGNDSYKREYEQAQALKELEEELAKARETGNQKAIENIQEAIRYQQELYAEKEKQIEQEKRQQAEREKSRNERKERREEPTRNGGGSGDAQFDAGKLSKEFKQSFEGAFDLNKLSKEFRKAFENEINQIDFSGFIKDLAQGVGKQLIQQLKDEASRMAR